MPRHARIVCPGLPHHLTQRGNNKQEVFHDDDDRNKYVQLLYHFKKECKCVIHAYCLMGNHVHLLMTPQTKEMLGKMLQKVSLTYTQYYNGRYHRCGRLWGSRFYSSVVGDRHYLWTVNRYIERNPVRAGIVRKANEYKWSSVYAHRGNIRSKLLNPLWKNENEKNEYLKFLNASDEEAELKQLRQAAISGKPYGSEVFIEKICKRVGIRFHKKCRGRPRKNKKIGTRPIY